MWKYAALVSILIASLSQAQQRHEDPLYHLLTQQRFHECSDFFLNAQQLIPDYYYQGKIDSIYMIMDYIKSECGDDAFYEVRALLAIDSGNFSDDWCDTVIINDILNSSPREWSSNYRRITRWFPIRSDIFEPDFFDFLQSLAFNLSLAADSNSVAFLLCKYYSGSRDEALKQLRDKQYPGTCIQDMYNAKADSITYRMENSKGHMSLGMGLWSPRGHNEALGNKGELNAAIGYRGKNMGFDIIGALRFGGVRNDYIIEHNDTLISTDSYLGFLIGLQITREIVNLNSLQFEGFVGAGYDGFDALGSEYTNDSEVISSVNFNLGVTSRLFIDRKSTVYVGLQFRYDFIDYDNMHGTNLRGNALTINFVFGQMANAFAIHDAERLGMFK